MPDIEPEQPELGDLDGEPVVAVTLKITGAAAFTRRLQETEAVVLVLTGGVMPGTTVKRIDGRLTRIQTVKISQLAEPTEQLADEAAAFLQAIADEAEGKQALPFDDAGAADPSSVAGGWGYDQPDPQPSDEEE